MASFREQLIHFMNNYTKAKTETFKEHPLGILMRKEIPNNIYKQLELERNRYSVKGSVGQGNWAYVPWIAIMNREVTTSTQRGYYLVYLFNEEMTDVYLAFAQGVTETPPKEMDRINTDIREKLNIKETRIHIDNNFYLGESKFAKDYKKSTAIYIPYSINNMPSDEQLWEDLKLMLNYYEQYIEIANNNSFPSSIEKLLSSLISSYTNEADYYQVYGEMKESIAELLANKKINDPKISQYSKDLLSHLPFIKTFNSTYKLVQYTTLDFPDSSYENTMKMLQVLLGEDSHVKEEIKSRAIHGLRILQYIDHNENLNINEYPELFEQKRSVISVPLIKMILKLLKITNEWNENDKKQLIKDILRYTIVSSTDNTPIKESVLDKRYSYTIGWLKEVKLIDENLQIVDNELNDYIQNDLRELQLREKSINPKNEIELIDYIHQYIRAQGFYYKKDDIKNFYLSLRTKPFVIITGISGTGKSKIVEKFAESLGATTSNGRFQLIAIRPDWNDGSDLLGYVDIKGEFQPGPLTQTLEKAMDDLDKPYFVLLDEMNLARVEYYFSDMLSILESKKWDNNRIITSPVLDIANRQIYIPENVYLIGTVNMDETTHPFSPKVLDRANTIEFNDVDLMSFNFGNDSIERYYNVDNELLKSNFITLKDALPEHEQLILRTTEKLVEINSILEKSKRHFGYRVRDEICFYMIYNEKGKLMSENEAFDNQLMQKVLPKLSGSDANITEIIEQLFVLCTGQELSTTDLEQQIDNAFYPKSAQKLADMYMSQQENGFTSFWIV